MFQQIMVHPDNETVCFRYKSSKPTCMKGKPWHTKYKASTILYSKGAISLLLVLKSL